MKLFIRAPRLPRAMAPIALTLFAGAALLGTSAAGAAPDKAPAGPAVDCGEFGASSFPVNLAPCVGYAVGDTQAAEHQACLMAAICLDRALRQAAAGLGVPVPNCNDSTCTPPKYVGCFPALAFEDIAADLRIETEVVRTLDGQSITICTITPRANARVVSGCAQCLALEIQIPVV